MRRKTNVAWLAAYGIVMLAVALGVFAGRRAALERLTTPEARAQWEEWRAAEPNQSATGGVKRRPPSSAEPPALVLLRDHFVVMMFGALFFSSLLFVALMVAARGVFAHGDRHASAKTRQSRYLSRGGSSSNGSAK